jgi:hypothetical protein
MIGALLRYLVKREHMVVHTKMKRLYPEKEDRAVAYLTIGTTELEKIMFGEGEVLNTLMIQKSGDGWIVEVVEDSMLEDS